jgi:oligoribonuclease
MTGLDVDRHCIIQAAVIITDSALKPLEEFSCDIWQPESELEKMNPFVRDMHEKNGLVERVRQSKVDIADAEQRLLSIVAGWCRHPATLCGNSVWQDRKFIDRQMPGLAGYLHNRLLDVSALKVLAKQWYGDGALFTKPKGGEHDALVDIKNSIKELEHYKKSLFKA